jgi:hypothetical protein
MISVPQEGAQSQTVEALIVVKQDWLHAFLRNCWQMGYLLADVVWASQVVAALTTPLGASAEHCCQGVSKLAWLLPANA